MVSTIAFRFIILPQILLNNRTVVDNNAVANPFHVEDIFTARGYLRQSMLFYGSYSNMSFSLDQRNEYSMPYAYFMTMIVLYIVTFIIVSISMARSYRRSFIETAGGMQNLYALKIFCSWDFSITNRKAAQLKHMNIYNELQEVLNDIHHHAPKPSRLQKFWTFCIQLTAHVLAVCMLAGIGLGMWSLLQIIDDAMPAADAVNAYSSVAALYVAILVNGMMLVMQAVFSWMATMEDYKSARLSLHITLIRNYMLELVIVGVLMVFWLTKSSTDCWETSMGQEIYRLVVIDFIVFVLGGALLHFLRYLIFRFCWEKVGLPEFDISRGSLGLIFNQTLLWVGLLFSPPLVVMITIKMMITFYLKKTTLIYFCKPPSRLWRSAQTSTLFLVMVFVSLLGVVIVHGYIITQVKVSGTCGPFRGHDFMFQIFFESMLKLREGHWTWRIVVAITKPAVIGGILLAMCVGVYYLRSKSKARIGMVKILKEMLSLEAMDKAFLLSNITHITQGKDWLFDDNANADGTRDIYAESSSTWNYRDDMDDQRIGSSASNYNRLHVDEDDQSVFDQPSIRNRRF